MAYYNELNQIFHFFLSSDDKLQDLLLSNKMKCIVYYMVRSFKATGGDNRGFSDFSAFSSTSSDWIGFYTKGDRLK